MVIELSLLLGNILNYNLVNLVGNSGVNNIFEADVTLTATSTVIFITFFDLANILDLIFDLVTIFKFALIFLLTFLSLF